MLTNIGAGIGKGGGGAIAAEGGKVEEVIVQRQAGDAFIAHESGDERGSEQAASGGELERAAASCRSDSANASFAAAATCSSCSSRSRAAEP